MSPTMENQYAKIKPTSPKYVSFLDLSSLINKGKEKLAKAKVGLSIK